MGHHTEINTLCRLPKNVNPEQLKVGGIYTNILERERIIPLNIAILFIGADNWTFYGYCAARSVTIEKGKTKVTFEVLSIFNTEERAIYTKKFLEAAKLTAEVR